MGRPRTRVSVSCEVCGRLGPLNAKRYCSRTCFNVARTRPPTDRFWPKVNRDGPIHPVLGTRCWLWTGSTDPKGYGTFSMPPSKPAKAHRIAWTLTNGTIPERANVLHKCDVPLCVNAQEHLFLGSLADNAADCSEKGRARGPAVLTTDDVRVIRSDYNRGISQRELGRRFLVAQTNIQAIVTGRTWKHVK